MGQRCFPHYRFSRYTSNTEQIPISVGGRSIYPPNVHYRNILQEATTGCSFLYTRDGDLFTKVELQNIRRTPGWRWLIYGFEGNNQHFDMDLETNINQLGAAVVK